jgi:Domain of unknown function (DU1801)
MTATSLAPAAQALEAASAKTRPVADALYALLLRTHPKANQLAWPKQRIISFGWGPKKMSEHYAYLGIQSTHVNLDFYMGAHLDAPSNLLEGTGKNLRHIKLRSLEEVHSPAVKSLLLAAMNERKGALRS